MPGLEVHGALGRVCHGEEPASVEAPRWAWALAAARGLALVTCDVFAFCARTHTYLVPVLSLYIYIYNIVIIVPAHDAIRSSTGICIFI